MKVNFQRDYFYKNGRFRARNNPNQVLDSMAGDLPSDAEIIEGPAKAKRARKDDGAFKEDDALTPNSNEAWESGVALTSAPAPKKKA